MTMSSVVVVGNGFVRQLFDEQALFPEPMEKDFTAVGSAAVFAYGSNAYTFSVQPNRIVLQHHSDEAFSDELIHAAHQVAARLQSQSHGHGVTGLGLNFETLFEQSDGGATGTEFCRSLCDSNRIQQAIGSDFHEIQCQVVVLRGGLQYTLKIEPHIASRGANLYCSINGHQNIGPTDELSPKLQKARSAKEYALSVSSTLSREFEGER